ncbi:cyclic nucleotide-binding domain-containing protein [bacterium]|nr:cyclic nucleotide-binding domain-containing protein [bacterium]
MLDLTQLKSIGILNELNEVMLKKMTDKARLINVKAGTYLFREGDDAVNLYSVIEGKVVLEITQTAGTDFKIKDIVPTRSFGISSLVDTEVKHCVSHARTLVDSKLLVWKAADLEKLFQTDHKLGYLISKKVSKVLKDRLQSTYVQAAAV